MVAIQVGQPLLGNVSQVPSCFAYTDDCPIVKFGQWTARRGYLDGLFQSDRIYLANVELKGYPSTVNGYRSRAYHEYKTQKMIHAYRCHFRIVQILVEILFFAHHRCLTVSRT
jgi:hypothetical protein